MIQSGTFLNVVDNCGAKKVVCIKIIKSGYKQRYAEIGSTILISVKSTKFSKNMKVKKGEMHPAIVVRTKAKSFSLINNYRSYFENSVVILSKKNKLLGTRIFGTIPKQFKYSKFLKLSTLSSGVCL